MSDKTENTQEARQEPAGDAKKDQTPRGESWPPATLETKPEPAPTPRDMPPTETK